VSIVPVKVEVWRLVTAEAIVQAAVVAAVAAVVAALELEMVAVVSVMMVAVMVAAILELRHVHSLLSYGNHEQPVSLVSLHLQAQVQVDRAC
jgi:hypothetical protein